MNFITKITILSLSMSSISLITYLNDVNVFQILIMKSIVYYTSEMVFPILAQPFFWTGNKIYYFALIAEKTLYFIRVV